MSKESIHTVERQDVFKRIPLNCAFDVLRNGGTSTSLTFKNGRGIFNNVDTKIDYGKFDRLLENVSVEILIRPYGFGEGCGGTSKLISNGKFVIGLWGAPGNKNIFASSDESTYASSAVDSIPDSFLNTDIHIVYTRNAAGDKSNFYINGVLSGTTDQDSGTPVEAGNIIVGNDTAQNYTVNGEIELINFYRKILEPEECKNLYEGKRFRELHTPNTILEVSAQSGTISCRQGNTITNTAVTVFKDGDVRTMLFNKKNPGASKIDCGIPDTLIGDKSFIVWYKYYGVMGYSSNDILANGKVFLSILTPTTNICFYSNAVASYSSNYTYIKNIWTQVIVVRPADGVNTLMYINGVVDGAAQDSGTPTAGTTNLIIGNRNDGSKLFDGLLEPVKIINGLLIAEQCSQAFSESKHRYGL